VASLPMTHAGLQKAVTDLCDWLDIFWWHDTDSRKNKGGLPDLLIIGRRHDPARPPAQLWRELKVPPDHLSDLQRQFRDRALDAGSDWAIWTPDDWRSGRIRRELEALR
jgi:hypothetical protein